MKILLANKFYYRRGGDCIHTMNFGDDAERKHREAQYEAFFKRNRIKKD